MADAGHQRQEERGTNFGSQFVAFKIVFQTFTNGKNAGAADRLPSVLISR